MYVCRLLCILVVFSFQQMPSKKADCQVLCLLPSFMPSKMPIAKLCRVNKTFERANAEKLRVFGKILILPEQQVAYSSITMFWQVDKMNGIDVRYIIVKQGSQFYGWTPKLSFWYFNMTIGNAYKIYRVVHKRSHGL